jgi:hypothetical protein
MPFKINDMITNLKGGGARPTLFQVEITSPFDPGLRDILPFMAQATTIPSSTITPIEVPYFGRKIKLAGDRTFDTWSVSILNDEDFQVRQYMERWHNFINSLEGNVNTTGSAAPRNYKSPSALVKQYGKSNADTPIRVYQLHNLFPVDISAINLNWDATDQIETFDVTFSYDWYTIQPVSGVEIK